MKLPFYKVRQEYSEVSPKGNWFSEGSMKYFKSRMPQYCYKKDEDYFFITSEKLQDNDRKYTVRKFDRTSGNIRTVECFNEMTRSRALILLARILGKRVKEL